MATKSARRGAGTGSLHKDNKTGLWVAVLELPDRDGKRRRKVIRRASKGAAAEALRAARKDLDRAGDLTTSSPTVAQWMTVWLNTIAAPRLKPRTLTGYRGSSKNYIVPTIGKVRLDKLTQDHVRRMHRFMLDERGLSTTTTLQAHRILSKALTDAMREGRVSRNVADGQHIDAPTKALAVLPSLPADDARTLLMSVASDPPQALNWSLALLAGLRQGERLGLTVDEVDLKAGVLTVAWQVQRLTWRHGCGAPNQDAAPWPCGFARGGSCPQRHIFIPADQEAIHLSGGLWMTRPKSRAGWRQVPIAPLLVEVLRRYMDANPPGMHGLISARPDGRPVDPRDDSLAWDAAIAAAGLPDVPLHSARHTCATLLYALGVDVQTRMAILGHSSATTTAGYTHISTPQMADAMRLLGTHLSPPVAG